MAQLPFFGTSHFRAPTTQIGQRLVCKHVEKRENKQTNKNLNKTFDYFWYPNSPLSVSKRRVRKRKFTVSKMAPFPGALFKRRCLLSFQRWRAFRNGSFLPDDGFASRCLYNSKKNYKQKRTARDETSRYQASKQTNKKKTLLIQTMQMPP